MRTAQRQFLAWLVAVMAGCGSAATPAAGPSDAKAGDTATDTAPSDTAPSDAAALDATTADNPQLDAAGLDTQDTAADPWTCPTAAEPACGGDLENTTWSVVEFCAEDPTAAAALFEHPFGNVPACQPPGGTVAGKLGHTGKLHFENGQVQIELTTTAYTSYTFSDACLLAAKPESSAASAACASLAKPGVMDCAYSPGTTPGGTTPGGTCLCKAIVPGDSSKGSEPFSTVAGHTLMIGGEMQADYCVQGDRLLMDITPHIKSWRWWLLKRQP